MRNGRQLLRFRFSLAWLYSSLENEKLFIAHTLYRWNLAAIHGWTADKRLRWSWIAGVLLRTWRNAGWHLTSDNIFDLGMTIPKMFLKVYHYTLSLWKILEYKTIQDYHSLLLYDSLTLLSSWAEYFTAFGMVYRFLIMVCILPGFLHRTVAWMPDMCADALQKQHQYQQILMAKII